VVMLPLPDIDGMKEWQTVADRAFYTRYKNVYIADGPVWTQSARQ